MMSQAQVFEFQSLIKRVAAVFRVRTDTEDFKGLASSYFRALSKSDLGDLERGADAWIATGERFPKPHEWVKAIPRPERVYRVMTDTQAREWHRAERLGWEDEPCACLDCKAAQVEWKPIRFVPDVTDYEDVVLMKDPIRDKIQTAGHWAHGEELKRWYAAKGAFWQRCDELGLRQALRVLRPKKIRVKEKTDMTQVGR